jgi:hypothetical protein
MRREQALVVAALAVFGSLGISCGSSSSPSPPPADGAGGTTGTGGTAGHLGGNPGSGGASATASGGATGTTPDAATGADAADAGAATGSGGRNGGGTGGASGSAGAGGTTTGATGLTLVPAWPNGAILTGVRDTATPAVTQAVQLRNEGTTPVTVTALAISGTNQGAFALVGAPATPFTVAPGPGMALTVSVATTGAALPAAPAQNSGGTLLTATLTATAGAAATHATLYALLLTTPTHEVTLGQILVTLGFKLNVGLAQNNANPNTGTVQQLPKIEAGTDEIAAPLFRKMGTGNVTLNAVARFSPKGPMPFGWYPAGNPATRNPVATMASVPDLQTSDKARMVLPPLTGSTGFDPGAASFGVWVYTDQLTQRYDTGGVATNGDYDYSEDAPNSPANVHRTKVYPLKDAAGVTVPGSFLLAVEEAGNGDYQDYVFVLSNVTPAN